MGLIGKGLLSFACISLLLVSLKLLFYLDVGKSVFFLSLLLASLVIIAFTEKSKRLSMSTAINIIIFLFIIFGAIKVSESIYDFSYDGQGYHQEALMYLDDGWNPVYEQTELGPLRDLWVTHYAKAIWFMGFSIYEVTDKIETGKAINLILLISTTLLLIEFLRGYSLSWIRTLLITFAAIASPVVINQVFTNYNDFHIHLLLLNLIIGYLTYFRRYDYSSLLILFFTMIILANIKFTALGYAVIFTGIPILIVLYKKLITKELVHYKKLTITLIASLVIAVGVVGASSYIKNTITNGHPFYPLAGEGKVDIMSSNTPEQLLDNNRVEKLFISTFSKTTNEFNGQIEYKIPFTMTLHELSAARATDTRIGGFGPLFGGAIILFLAACLVHFRKIIQLRTSITLGILFIVIALSIFINPETFWARYIPQLWFVPLVLLVFLNANKIKSKLLDLMLVVLIINSVMVSAATAEKIYTTKAAQDQDLAYLAEVSKEQTLYINFGFFTGNRMKFEERAIDYVEVTETTCESPMRLTGSVTEICFKEQ